MDYNKKRTLLLKEIKRELKIYLQAFDPKHPLYKRNIKNLYEGLTDLGIVENIESIQNLKEFKQAFAKADKGLKEALILAHIFESNDIAKYYQYQGKPLNRVKLISGAFFGKALHHSLTEAEVLKHTGIKEKQAILLEEKRRAKEMRKELQSLKKNLNKAMRITDKEYYRLHDKLTAYANMIGEIRRDLGIPTYDDKDKSNLAFLSGVKGNIAEHPEVWINEIDWRIDSATTMIDYTLDTINEEIQDKSMTMSKMESMIENIVKNVKLRTDLMNEELTTLRDYMQITKGYVLTKGIESKHTYKNVVKGLTDMIELRKQLWRFMYWMLNKKFALQEPWKIMGYGSGGVDKRSHGLVTGDRKEGFYLRDFKWLLNQLLVYAKLFEGYYKVVLNPATKEDLAVLIEQLIQLSILFDNNPEFFEQEKNIRTGTGAGREEKTGYIINIMEHEATMKMVNKIKSSIQNICLQTAKAIYNCDDFINHQKGLIQEAESGKKSAQTELRRLNNISTGLDRLEGYNLIRKVKIDN